jgi:hypothetical protein
MKSYTQVNRHGSTKLYKRLPSYRDKSCVLINNEDGQEIETLHMTSVTLDDGSVFKDDSQVRKQEEARTHAIQLGLLKAK